uniref:Uncharacterized protein n=1 Tax=Arundo donax TaxID=35708 RepID=A0A0A9G4G6_ARUDO
MMPSGYIMSPLICWQDWQRMNQSWFQCTRKLTV